MPSWYTLHKLRTSTSYRLTKFPEPPRNVELKSELKLLLPKIIHNGAHHLHLPLLLAVAGFPRAPIFSLPLHGHPAGITGSQHLRNKRLHLPPPGILVISLTARAFGPDIQMVGSSNANRFRSHYPIRHALLRRWLLFPAAEGINDLDCTFAVGNPWIFRTTNTLKHNRKPKRHLHLATQERK
jgi:hypothetical protein